MRRHIALGYGIVSYLIFFVAFLYAIGFVENLIVPKGIDSGASGYVGQALIINVILLGIFALQHSVMARLAFKRWWTRIVPEPLERSTYVLLSSLLLLMLYWQWRPIPGTLWSVSDPIGRRVLDLLFWLGWAQVLISTFLIDHFDLFGLRQVWSYWEGIPYKRPPFQTTGFYRYVRHPLMLGFLLAFWATPEMSYGHLFFSLATTGYILIAIQFEERTLVALLGTPYEEYRRRVPMLVPLPGHSMVYIPGVEQNERHSQAS